MVLRVEKKLYVIEQPISPAPPTDTTAQMKGYVEQLERLGYVLSQDISVGLILNGLTSDFVGFVRNYNMHNMGKTIGKLHALLIKYEKGLPKKAATPQVMAIQGGRTRKPIRNRLMLKAKHPEKDDSCHHFKEVGHGKRNCHAYLAELIKKQKQVGIASSSDYEFSVSNNYVLYFNVIPSDGVYEINMLNLVPNVNSIYNDASYFITFTDDYSHYGYVYLLKHKHEVFEVFETFKVFKNEVENQLGKTIKALR
ncbi:hypothetical protein Tco_1444760 [Tanacetum coccineum]